MPDLIKGLRRFDIGEVSSVQRTPQGFLRCDGTITKTGVFTYRNSDGSLRRELRLPEEVFHKDALESFGLAPLTNNHPGEGLTAKNTGKFQVGTVANPRRDEHRVSATIQITDAEAIEDAENGKRQLSCGYDADLEMRPGVTDGIDGVSDGLAFDGIQRNIRGNHVAMVDIGRAGPEASLRLDHDDAIQISELRPGTGAGIGQSMHRDGKKLGDFIRSEMEKKEITLAQLASAAGIDESTVGQIVNGDIEIPPERRLRGFARVLGVSIGRLMSLLPKKDQAMDKKIKIDGVTFEVSEQVAEAVAKVQARADAANAKIEEIKASTATEKARADKAEEDLAAEKKAREDAIDPKNVKEAVSKRLDLERSAVKVLGETTKIDSKDVAIADLEDNQILRAVVIAASKDPEGTTKKLDADDCEPAYLQARFDAAIDTYDPENEPNGGLDRIRDAAKRTSHSDKAAGARQKMIEDNAKLGRESLRPAAAS